MKILLALLFTIATLVATDSVARTQHHSRGMSTDTWLKTAGHLESTHNPKAVNRHTGAAGRYQFVKGTWRVMISRYGHKYGYTQRTSRFDPVASRNMAKEYRNENARVLRKALGREPTHTDLYAAHLLGAGGAAKVLRAAHWKTAANLLPKAAKYNRKLFYTSSGKARSVRQFNAYLAWRFNVAATKTA